MKFLATIALFVAAANADYTYTVTCAGASKSPACPDKCKTVTAIADCITAAKADSTITKITVTGAATGPIDTACTAMIAKFKAAADPTPDFSAAKYSASAAIPAPSGRRLFSLNEKAGCAATITIAGSDPCTAGAAVTSGETVAMDGTNAQQFDAAGLKAGTDYAVTLDGCGGPFLGTESVTYGFTVDVDVSQSTSVSSAAPVGSDATTTAAAPGGSTTPVVTKAHTSEGSTGVVGAAFVVASLAAMISTV